MGLFGAAMQRVMVAVVALAAGIQAMPAQAQGWRIDRDEYSCRAHNGDLRLIDQDGKREFRTGRNLSYDRQMPLRIGSRPDGGVLPGFRIEQHVYPAISNASGSSPAKLHIEVSATLSREVQSTMIATDMLYVIAGRQYSMIPLGGIAQAFAQLDRCSPVVPPPNRPAGPAQPVSRWIRSDFAGTFPIGVFRGFEAEIAVDARGKMVSCKTAVSTGNAVADARYCEAARRYGRFNAATDSRSRHIPGIVRIAFPGVDNR
jgi:hypothetical protein